MCFDFQHNLKMHITFTFIFSLSHTKMLSIIFQGWENLFVMYYHHLGLQ